MYVLFMSLKESVNKWLEPHFQWPSCNKRGGHMLFSNDITFSPNVSVSSIYNKVHHPPNCSTVPEMLPSGAILCCLKRVN